MTPQDTEYQAELVRAYVPEASQLTWGEAVDLAMVRDELAAQQLAESAETQLQLEAAARAANATIDQFFTGSAPAYRLN